MILMKAHNWNLTPRDAIVLQAELAPNIRLCNEPHRVPEKLICGIDVSYSRQTNTCYAAVVVMMLCDFEIIEESTAVMEAQFPYVPGLLSFREGPVIATALEALTSDPDVLIFDGQGIAHPRGFGLASHIGILFDRPSIGCAKSRLLGKHEEPGIEKGEATPLLHPQTEHTIGYVLRSRKKVKPLYISPGHRFSPEGALNFMQRCLGPLRLPPITRRAHILSNELRKKHEGDCAA